MKKWCQSYTNEQCDFYPEDIHAMMDVMCTIPTNKSKPTKDKDKKKKKEDASKETSFAQKGREKDKEKRYHVMHVVMNI